MCENAWNEIVFVMDYLIRCTTSPLCHFTFCWSKKIFFICIKSPSCPLQKCSIPRVRLCHLLGLKRKLPLSGVVISRKCVFVFSFFNAHFIYYNELWYNTTRTVRCLIIFVRIIIHACIIRIIHHLPHYNNDIIKSNRLMF